MFRHGGLRKTQWTSADRQRSAIGQKIDNLPSPRFGNGVEDVGGRSGSWHEQIVFPYGNVSSPHPPN